MKIRDYESCQRTLISVDCIIFGFDGRSLKALLIRRGFKPMRGKWSLMGGFVREDETADHAAGRVLLELTGMARVYLEQMHVFTDVRRDSAARVISIAYFSLINIAEYSEQLQLEHEARWFPLDEIPDLIFDHTDMVLMAKDLLRQKARSQPIGFELLPRKFTLPQFLHLYEAIYESEVDRRNLSKKMSSLGILQKLQEKNMQGSKKGAFYYRFDYDKYARLKRAGAKLAWI